MPQIVLNNACIRAIPEAQHVRRSCAQAPGIATSRPNRSSPQQTTGDPRHAGHTLCTLKEGFEWHSVCTKKGLACAASPFVSRNSGPATLFETARDSPVVNLWVKISHRLLMPPISACGEAGQEFVGIPNHRLWAKISHSIGDAQFPL